MFNHNNINRLQKEKLAQLNAELQKIEAERAAVIAQNERYKTLYQNKNQKWKQKCRLLADQLDDNNLSHLVEQNGLQKYISTSATKNNCAVLKAEANQRENENVELIAGTEFMKNQQVLIDQVNKELCKLHHIIKIRAMFDELPQRPVPSFTFVSHTLQDFLSFIKNPPPPVIKEPKHKPQLSRREKWENAKKSYPKLEETPTFIPYTFDEDFEDDDGSHSDDDNDTDDDA
uniref:Uncharacterized protein n=1 Tax=Panagrolaimus superbus TaxID=310955 RepID=A0A914YYN3_9BILA